MVISVRSRSMSVKEPPHDLSGVMASLAIWFGKTKRGMMKNQMMRHHSNVGLMTWRLWRTWC